MGHDVFMVSRGGSYVDLLQEHGVTHISIQDFCKKWSFGFLSLAMQLVKTRPDIIHAHMMAAALLSFIISRILRIKLVTTMHNSFDGHSFLMKLGDRVVAVSIAEQKKLLSLGYSRKKLRMIHNGPIGTVRSILPNDGARSIPTPCVITLSGLHARKRVDCAIEAFAMVHNDYSAWSLVIVGEGPDEKNLKNLAITLGVADRVMFAGETLNPHILLQQASIFLALSDAEPFGLVVIEARAAGCAIIVTKVGGMPEIVDQGFAGMIVERGDTEAVAANMRRLMSDQMELAYWKMKAAKGVEKYSVNNMATSYINVYAELLNK
jgi:glycosyltransferase involved in cell wall biosynthesis